MPTEHLLDGSISRRKDCLSIGQCFRLPHLGCSDFIDQEVDPLLADDISEPYQDGSILC